MPSIPFGLKRTATLVILRHEDQFLLLKRFKEPNKGMFTPVGGKLDPFESPRDCAIRETREETGIELNEVTFCGLLTETSPTKYNWCNYVYRADIPWQLAPASNEGELKWIGKDQLLQVPTHKTDWFMYQYVMEEKPFAFHAEFDGGLNLVKMEEEWGGVISI